MPLEIDALAPVTAIETNVAAVTCNVTDLLMVPVEAWIVVVPTPIPRARPPLEIVATPVFCEVQVTVPVTSRVVPSLKVPMAVNCVVNPLAIFKFAAVMEIDCRVARVVALFPEDEQLIKTTITQRQIIRAPTFVVELRTHLAAGSTSLN
jgi:hypothetical protein